MEIPKELQQRFIVGAKLVDRPSCVIFRGVDRQLGDRSVAIKIYLDKPNDQQDWITAFDREIAILRASSHPSLVPIIAGGYESGWFFIAMEFIEGPNLRDLLKSQGAAFDCDRAIDIAVQISAGLKEIHEKNGFHGHLDSRAVLFKGNQVRLAGYYPHVISEVQKSQTSTGRLIVDPAYIAPEQFNGQAQTDGRADIYALAILLYEMLTGRRPFVAENPMQLAMMRLTVEPESPQKLNPAVSSLVDAAIRKGLARDPKDRFLNLAEFVDALTGGKKPIMNPLFAAMESERERIGGTETIAVSMSTDAIKHILLAHEGKQREEKPQSSLSKAEADLRRESISPSDEDLSSASTQIGMKIDQSLVASFIVLNDDLRGQKFSIERPQILIGSDSGCDIAFAKKGVPPRLAIVVQRDSRFFVAPLSASPIMVNEKKHTGETEIPLERGDILTVGSYQLRFVSPGEVFTLQKDIADRAIDRPPSKLPRILAAVAFLLMVLCGALFYSYKENVALQEAKNRQTVENRKKEQRSLIDRLRKEGDEFFAAGKLLEPVEANAKKRFEQILEIDKEDTYAKRRISEIVEQVKTLSEQNARRQEFAAQVNRLLGEGDSYFRSGNYISPPGKNAKESYEAVLRLDAQNEQAKKQLVEINRILGDLIGQLNGLLQKARDAMERRNYVTPVGDNGKEYVDKILAIDPSNSDAKELLLEMAARALLEGDIAKAHLRSQEMKQAYLTAQALGIDPDIITKKLQALEVMKRASSSVVIIDADSSNAASKGEKSGFLDMGEVNKRISALKVRGYAEKSDESKRLIEVR